MPKAKDCKLKCRSRLENEPLLNDDRVIQDFLTRKFLRFNISVFKEPNRGEGKSRGSHQNRQTDSTNLAAQNEAIQKGEINRFSTNYMINVQLVKGTPLVFLDFAQNFFNTFETRITIQHQLKM